MLDCATFKSELSTLNPYAITGRVLEVSGPVIKATLVGAAIGDLVTVATRCQRSTVTAQVVGFSRKLVLLSPFGSTAGIVPGAQVSASGGAPSILLGEHLRGAIVDGLGRLIYSSSKEVSGKRDSLYRTAPNPLRRKAVDEQFVTGIRAIDSFVALGRGQRLSVFAEPGVGKSTLLAMIAKRSTADVNVIGLIGERGREVRELLFESLDEVTRGRSVVVISTSDEAAICRVNAAHTATRIAEYFRDQGLNVLLQVDSLTRLLRGYREIGLAAGELPVRRGYPPSVFAEIPRLIERTGPGEHGTITAFYTVLLSSDLDEDPMVDEIKGLTDGHLNLKRGLAEQGHYPAIDVISSISRLAKRVSTTELYQAQLILRRMLSQLENERELLLLGTKPDAELSRALELESELLAFLAQCPDEITTPEQTSTALCELAAKFSKEL